MSKSVTTKHIHIKDFNYDLPDERIAKYPVSPRDHSKLLVYEGGEISQDIFYNLPKHLPSGALMIFNNTKVIQARLFFHKDTGARIEVFLMEPASPANYEQIFQTREKCSWYCMIGNQKKWKSGVLTQTIMVKGMRVNLSIERNLGRDFSKDSSHQWVTFTWDDASIIFSDILEAFGVLPIPPYLNRETVETDKETYQTVYSKINGSVAAPTAGLHFTENVLQEIDDRNVVRDEVTLHVGAGTFKPVKSEEIEGHEMHTEFISVRRSTIENLLKHDASAIAVGTTSVRTLESLYYIGTYLDSHPDASEEDLHVQQWTPYEENESSDDEITAEQALKNVIRFMELHSLDTLHSSTQIIIAPGYRYKIVKMLITNFHQPQSTLLLLVSAFVKGDWRRIYDYALSNDFRFLSYGDSSLLIP